MYVAFVSQVSRRGSRRVELETNEEGGAKSVTIVDEE